MRVLLVEDDAGVAQSIELMLKVEDMYVYRTDLGEEGVDLGKIYDYDIILLDLTLPDISGYEVLRSLRLAKVATPVLILSGLASIEDKIKGLGLGADDYLSKPFHKDELVARIHALVRRSKGHAESVIAVGDLIVDLEARTVKLNGRPGGGPGTAVPFPAVRWHRRGGGARHTGRPGRPRCFPGGRPKKEVPAKPAARIGTAAVWGKRSLAAQGERSESPVAGTEGAAQAGKPG